MEEAKKRKKPQADDCRKPYGSSLATTHRPLCVYSVLVIDTISRLVSCRW